MLAITVSDPDLIAIIGLVLAVVVGTPAWLNYLARHRNTRAIGEVHEWVRPNGRGTMVEMLEASLERIDAIEQVTLRDASRLEQSERDLERIRGTLASITAQGIDHEINDERRAAERARKVAGLDDRLTALDGEMAVVARELAQITSEVARIRSACTGLSDSPR